MTLKDFDYELPKELIAPYPAPKRSEARLLVLNRKSGQIEHRIFKEIVDYLRPGDLLVLNNTKVLPARLFGRKPTGGKVEALLLRPIPSPFPLPSARGGSAFGGKGERVGVRGDWEMLVKPSGRIKKGTKISFGENGIRLEGEVLDEPDGETGIRRIRFNVGAGPSACPQGNHGGLPLQAILNQIGRIPLPPYIDRPDEAIDRERYQTVFAEKEGAVASPTAGLHFDRELIDTLHQKGIETCFVTLHVSYGTFQTVQIEDLSAHKMYEEAFEIVEKSAGQIERAVKENRRIIACGTTVVRTLETMAHPLTLPSPPSGERVGVRGKTRLFIYPPYEFKRVDAMITNFHLPRTTLLMLVSAFAGERGQAPFGGRNLVFRAYEVAVRERYRFYSYGDAMLIL